MLPSGLAWLEPFLAPLGVLFQVLLWWGTYRWGTWKPWRENVTRADWMRVLVRRGRVVRHTNRPRGVVLVGVDEYGQRFVGVSSWRARRALFRDSLLVALLLDAVVIGVSSGVLRFG